jgi:Protein of unknown function (DUF1360)
VSLSAVVVLGLAVARLWRLISQDLVLAPLRDRLVGAEKFKVGDAEVAKNARPAVVEFLGCPWCLGFWLSIPAVALWRYAPDDVVLWIVGVLAVSEVVGLIVRNLDPVEE